MTRNFAIRAVLFILLLVAINIILDQSFKAFSVHNILNRMMDRQFAGYDDTLKYLAMGNSHNCVNTHILENSFNYGSPSENLIQSYYKLKHILEKSGRKPEYLLLQTDISSFGPKAASRYEYNSYWIDYIDYIELARIRQSKDVLNKWIEGKFFSYAGNYKDIQLSILYRIKMKNIEMYHGFRPHRDYRNFADEPDPRKLARDKARLILAEGIYFDNTNRVYFEKIMQICNEHGVKVILMRIPMTRQFNEEEAKIVPVEKLFDEVLEIATKYPVFQALLDYHDLFADRPELFFDPDHLNVRGTDLFSEKLAGDLGFFEREGFPGQP